VLRAHGADVIVVARSHASRSLASSLGLATSDLDGTLALARRYDVAVDATGNPAGFASAAALVRPRGTLVVKSTIHGETPVALSPLVVDEITIVGSRCGPFGRAIELLGAGRIDVKPLVRGVYPLEQHADAFACAERGGKAILLPRG
jgi:threonine dehydrogenase-like Zn-dependent dehydrogenase